ncbi:YecA family protein [Serratia microhaemolytica]|uniref:YecA family protein n=1 Tax=Serratia microhaemolytica TaxID=2675110 RepID=UPI000FDDB16D|nr:SEC-C domain-containing protein [Serratia microhaemolytica]
MEPGRNDLCPCGSNKKYKHCCLSNTAGMSVGLLDEIKKIVAMNPSLTVDELNVLMENRVEQYNNRPNADFCGLSSTQMINWLYEPFDEKVGLTINTPDDLSASPVMRYLALIVDEAMANGGSFKATSKGNLPTKLVKQAGNLLPEFAVSKCEQGFSTGEFSGNNEERFNALHYTRVLAEIAGIIYRRSGRYHVKKAAQKQYRTEGLRAFFKPMLQAAVTRYNWGYLDYVEGDIDLRPFWLFMLWRLQHNADLDQLIAQMVTAFPELLHHQIMDWKIDDVISSKEMLGLLIEWRFIDRFLQFWGFVTFDCHWFLRQKGPRQVNIQPLLTQTFQFNI